MNIIFANRDNIGLMELLMLMIYSLFDVRVNMILIAKKIRHLTMPYLLCCLSLFAMEIIVILIECEMHFML